MVDGSKMTELIPTELVNIKKVPASGQVTKIIAGKAELSQIVDHLDVEAVESISSNMEIKQWSSGGIVVLGDFNTSVIQNCASTNDPTEFSYSGEFKRYFIPEPKAASHIPDIIDGEMVLDPEDDDYPDVLETDVLNLWEVLIEELNLEIDPYPRSIDAKPHGNDEETQSQEPTHNPFSDLKALMTEKKSGT